MSTEQSSAKVGRQSRRSSDHLQNRIPNGNPHGLQSTISFYMDQSSAPISAPDPLVTDDLIALSADLVSTKQPQEGGMGGHMLENNQLVVQKTTPTLGDQMPMIPLRKFQQKEGIVVNTVDPDTLPSWYVVLSPRETVGSAGPFTVNDLRIKFKANEIHEKTLAWTNGYATWHELRHMPYLFPRVQQPPDIPARKYEPKFESLADLEKELDRSAIPINQAADVVRFAIPSLDHICIKCGAFATVYTPNYGEQPLPSRVADMVGVDLPPQTVTEIIPGFLWVGNIGSGGRGSNLEKLRVTLVINCTEDLKTAPSKPPQYRCHRAPMKEYKKKGKSVRDRVSVSERSVGTEEETEFTSEAEILETFTSVCDYMDWERSHQEKVPLSDYLLKSKHATVKYTGPVDSKGRPKVPYKEVPKPGVLNSSHKEKGQEETKGGTGSGNQDNHHSTGEKTGSVAGGGEGEVGEGPQDSEDGPDNVRGKGGPVGAPRVLLWSRLGIDRPCAVAVAYLIRTWKLKLSTAMAEVKKGRYGMKLSEPYLQALTTWEKRYASDIGESFCDDCIEFAVERVESTRHTPSSLLPFPTHLHGVTVHGGPSHHGPSHGVSTNGDSLHAPLPENGNAHSLLVSALKDKEKDKSGTNKRMTTFGGETSLHSQDSDEETALTHATGLTTIHDHNQASMSGKSVDSYFDEEEGGVKSIERLTSLFQASNKFEKYLMYGLDDAMRTGMIDKQQRTKLGQIGAWLVPVYQKGVSANVKSGVKSVSKSKLGPGTVQGPGLGLEQERDKRIDIRLGGRGLGDAIIKCVFTALAKARLIAYVRDIDVHANDLSCEGIIALCDAFLGPKHKKGSRRSQKNMGGGDGQLSVSIAGSGSIVGIGQVLCMQVTLLEVLNLAHNRIGPRGAERISDLLRSCTSLASLDIFGNQLGEAGCLALALTLTLPQAEFEEDDEEEEIGGGKESNALVAGGGGGGGGAGGEEDNDLPLIDSPMKLIAIDEQAHFNRSLEEMRLGGCGMGPLALKALEVSLQTNRSLHTLVFDLSPDLTSVGLKSFLSNLSLRNSTLQRLSFSDTPVSVKTLGYILRAFDDPSNGLSHLDLARSSLTSKHLGLLPKYGAGVFRKLISLNLSGNHFGDLGAVYVSNYLASAEKYSKPPGWKKGMIQGPDGTWTAPEYISIDELGSEKPIDDLDNPVNESFKLEEEDDDEFPDVMWEVYPYALRYLDLSDCGITKNGGYPVIQTIAMNSTAHLGSLIYLDLSDNPLGADFFSPDLREKKGPGSRRSSQNTSRNGSVAGGVVLGGIGVGMGGGVGLGGNVGLGGRGKVFGMEGSVGQLSHLSHQSGSLSGPGGSGYNSGSGHSSHKLPVGVHGLSDRNGGVRGGGVDGGVGDMDSLSSSSQAANPAYHLPEGVDVDAQARLAMASDMGNIGNEVLACLSRCDLVDLRLNRTGLTSRGAQPLFYLLATTSELDDRASVDTTTTLGKTLRALYVSGNKICDSCATPLKYLLNDNTVIEMLDIGFNKLSVSTASYLSEATKHMKSNATDRRKYVPLTVMAQGNNCDPYAIALPQRARSKNMFSFGFDLSEAYTHTTTAASATKRVGMFPDPTRLRHYQTYRKTVSDILASHSSNRNKTRLAINNNNNNNMTTLALTAADSNQPHQLINNVGALSSSSSTTGCLSTTRRHNPLTYPILLSHPLKPPYQPILLRHPQLTHSIFGTHRFIHLHHSKGSINSSSMIEVLSAIRVRPSGLATIADGEEDNDQSKEHPDNDDDDENDGLDYVPGLAREGVKHRIKYALEYLRESPAPRVNNAS